MKKSFLILSVILALLVVAEGSRYRRDHIHEIAARNGSSPSVDPTSSATSAPAKAGEIDFGIEIEYRAFPPSIKHKTLTQVTFKLTVKFAPSSYVKPLTITTLKDDFIGNLHRKGSCLLPQTIQRYTEKEAYTCWFTLELEGSTGDVFHYNASAIAATSSSLTTNTYRKLQVPVEANPCFVNSYSDLLAAVESATGKEKKEIVLCGGTIYFPSEVDLTNKSVVMSCPKRSCILDGNGESKLFRAGRDSSKLSDHYLEFENLAFRNGRGNVSNNMISALTRECDTA